MGNLREWSNQAAGQPPTRYEPSVYFPWAALTMNKAPGSPGVHPDTGEPTWTPATFEDYENFFGYDVEENGGDGTFNLALELYFLRDENGGNPYRVSAYDPEEDLLAVEDALGRFEAAVRGQDAGEQLGEATRIAVEQARELLGDGHIEEIIAAETARMRRDHLSSKSQLLTDLWLGGGLLVTQTAGDLAALEEGFHREVGAFAAKLRGAHEERRGQAALQLVELTLRQQERGPALAQAYVTAAIDALRVRATVKQDHIDKELEYDIARRFHNVSLLQMALNANTVIMGAQVTPRAQTKGERLTASVMGAASMGLQGGQAMGNPMAGVGLAGLSFLTSMIQ